jgi:hypothetical protein
VSTPQISRTTGHLISSTACFWSFGAVSVSTTATLIATRPTSTSKINVTATNTTSPTSVST